MAKTNVDSKIEKYGEGIASFRNCPQYEDAPLRFHEGFVWNLMIDE